MVKAFISPPEMACPWNFGLPMSQRFFCGYETHEQQEEQGPISNNLLKKLEARSVNTSK